VARCRGLIEPTGSIGFMKSTTITISGSLRAQLLKLAAELQMRVGRKVDYEDVILHLIRQHRKNPALLEKACAPVKVHAKELRKAMRVGRDGDLRKEEELERRQ
jgi:hypothetical protein